MIVPTSRSVRLFAVTVLPAALVLAAVPAARLAVSAGCLLIAAIAAADAFLAERRGRGITLEFPARLKLSQDREATVSFTVSHRDALPARVAVALQSPEGFSSTCQVHPVELPEAGQVRVQWPITGKRRGSFTLPPCRLRVRSPLGLWHAQGSRPADTELRVYPNLRGERKGLAALLLNRNDARVRAQRQVGQGREFEKLRLYLPGDSLGDIHWRATAKRGQLVTKEYRCERTQEVYVIIDASRLSARPVASAASPEEESLLERYIRSALVLGTLAQKQGDLFGVLAFSDRVLSFKRAAGGKEHFGRCRDALYTLSPGTANPGYEEAASFLARKLKRRALLIFLTSLEEPAMAEGFLKSIGVVSRRHLVSVAMLRPLAARPLFSGQQAEKVDDLYRHLGGHLLWHTLREMQQNLRLRGVQLALLNDERLSAGIISQYLDVKRRQLL